MTDPYALKRIWWEDGVVYVQDIDPADFYATGGSDMLTDEEKALVERLRATTRGYGSRERMLVNPDGPAAADLIEKLAGERIPIVEMKDLGER